ncbi:ImmA/IrrE family metallo-endopeptidase [Xanthomonas hortorum]|uniref:ImmA/IrrE family metallo-endopeptidase n=1 Tax=Xanthomonas hortorum TaxID=56454 RepID=UPI001F25ECA9|nr:ImmA/IrrE family metallo-endopeptidase [Xanthomonas hortorum]MCE4512808.1 ImmA/IrrE family metallo-endopeptidase [Xanthomonas hortorum pv. vitians]MCE4520947.1 ImmA/IrrE family metallo-endopeptidase [Xanthomonas hortorum pv. vitians]
MNSEIKFNLQWSDAEATSLAKISVSVDGDVIWPAAFEDAYLEIFVDDILVFLVESWHFLLVEKTYPIIEPRRPSALRDVVETRWSENPSLDTEDESIKVEEYELRHNFATCFSGIYDLPPLWLVRSQEGMFVDNGKDVWEAPLASAIVELERLADTICNRISEKDKYKKLIAAWSDRASARDQLTLLATSIGAPRGNVEVLVNANLLSLPSDLNEAANDDDELRIAARVTGSLDLGTIKFVLKAAKSVPAVTGGDLPQLRDFVKAAINQSEYQRPHDVGLKVAAQVRTYFNLDDDRKVDLDSILGKLGVWWQVLNAGDTPFKGLAIWGPSHGPGVIVGERSPSEADLHGSAFQRVTVAHELGHLLMDEGHTIGAVDVLNGRVPRAMEQRAKAFAAELLLPARSAADAWNDRGRKSDDRSLRGVLEYLRRKYGVTKAVAAWKLEHRLKQSEVDLSSSLDRIAPSRWNSL